MEALLQLCERHTEHRLAVSAAGISENERERWTTTYAAMYPSDGAAVEAFGRIGKGPQPTVRMRRVDV
jgi:hypothetical protein